MELISEKTISDLYKSGSLVSGITQKALTKRLNSGNSRIELHSAIVNIKKKFIELIFYVASTSGNTEFIAATDLPQPKNGYYTVVVRFYDTDKYITKNYQSLPVGTQSRMIYLIITKVFGKTMKKKIWLFISFLENLEMEYGIHAMQHLVELQTQIAD